MEFLEGRAGDRDRCSIRQPCPRGATGRAGRATARSVSRDSQAQAPTRGPSSAALPDTSQEALWAVEPLGHELAPQNEICPLCHNTSPAVKLLCRENICVGMLALLFIQFRKIGHWCVVNIIDSVFFLASKSEHCVSINRDLFIY